MRNRHAIFGWLILLTLIIIREVGHWDQMELANFRTIFLFTAAFRAHKSGYSMYKSWGEERHATPSTTEAKHAIKQFHWNVRHLIATNVVWIKPGFAWRTIRSFRVFDRPENTTIWMNTNDWRWMDDPIQVGYMCDWKTEATHSHLLKRRIYSKVGVEGGAVEYMQWNCNKKSYSFSCFLI